MSLKFIRSSMVGDNEKLTAVLIIEIDDKGIFEVAYKNDDWVVMCNDYDGRTITVKWVDFLEIFYRMSVHVDGENKDVLKGEHE